MTSTPFARKFPTLLGTLLGLTLLIACGASPTPTPTPAPTPTPPPPTATATTVPTRAAATPGAGTPGAASPVVANPTTVTQAYTNLQKLDSYHLEIVASGFDKLLPVGIGSKLSYVIDFNKGNQHIVVDDGTGTKQEAYKVDNKFYIVANGQTTEATSLPLIYTLPDLLYSTLTAPGVMTFTAAGSEQVNGRSTTKYSGSGQLARLAANPLLAAAVGNASGDLSGPLWIDNQSNFLVAGDLAINLTAPQVATVKLRLDTTKVGQVAPITVPR